MKSKLILAAATALAFASPAMADGKALYMEKTCIACHGKDGKKPLTPEYPKLAGQNAKYAEKQMLDIKSGARANGNSGFRRGNQATGQVSFRDQVVRVDLAQAGRIFRLMNINELLCSRCHHSPTPTYP
jgi:cytochrome c